jgi:hypothetical protein
VACLVGCLNGYSICHSFWDIFLADFASICSL